MTPPLTSEALKHLRHDLRTPINHIIGYTEILLEDSVGADPAVTSQLRDLLSGGRLLLDCIQAAFSETRGTVTFDELRDFERGIRPDVERLLETSESLTGHLRQNGNPAAVADADRVSAALGRLLAVVREATHGETSAEPPAAPATPPVRPPEAPKEGAGRLLIVEDNPTNRDLLRRHLEKEGHEVHEAENGVQALELLRTASYDLLLLDIMMPEMDGFQVLARMKADPRLAALPVIMISALDEIQSVVRCIEMGAEDYLAKPFDPVLLRARIGASLEKKRLRDRERRKTEELEQALQRLKETQDQLVVQEKMASLGALTAGIAHEIKNPLNFVTNFAALSEDLLKELQDALATSSPVDEILADLTLNLQKIREHGKRADSIVRGMLAHSRGGSGRRETVDLNGLVSDAVNLAYHGLRAQDPAFNITIESQYDATLPPVSVVPPDLSRVVLNLANNACYAANQKRLQLGNGFRPTLRISTAHTGDSVEIRIRDNGAGIPKDALQKIFNPFFTTKPTGVGTGLGLSLSYQIVVEQHKGTIRVNTEEGEYTEFIITLPRRT